MTHARLLVTLPEVDQRTESGQLTLLDPPSAGPEAPGACPSAPGRSSAHTGRTPDEVAAVGAHKGVLADGENASNDDTIRPALPFGRRRRSMSNRMPDEVCVVSHMTMRRASAE